MKKKLTVIATTIWDIYIYIFIYIYYNFRALPIISQETSDTNKQTDFLDNGKASRLLINVKYNKPTDFLDNGKQADFLSMLSITSKQTS